jgi:hypothetical protein
MASSEEQGEVHQQTRENRAIEFAGTQKLRSRQPRMMKFLRSDSAKSKSQIPDPDRSP